jgi:hypothetical protein
MFAGDRSLKTRLSKLSRGTQILWQLPDGLTQSCGHGTLRRSRLAVDFRRKRLIFEMFELPLRF